MYYILMGSKVISITEDVYKLLKSAQFPGESFGDTIKRLCGKSSAKSLHYKMKNDSSLTSVPDDIWDSFEDDVKILRKRSLTNRDIDF